MASTRLQRTNEDIKLAMSALLREIKDPRVQQGMISITAVDTTGDLKYCKIYLSVLGLKSEKEMLKGLRSASGWLRRELGSRLRLRNVPELVFTLDKSIEHGAHINDIINSLNIFGETDEDTNDDK